jgi:hypothetical protein
MAPGHAGPEHRPSPAPAAKAPLRGTPAPAGTARAEGDANSTPRGELRASTRGGASPRGARSRCHPPSPPPPSSRRRRTATTSTARDLPQVPSKHARPGRLRPRLSPAGGGRAATSCPQGASRRRPEGSGAPRRHPAALPSPRGRAARSRATSPPAADATTGRRRSTERACVRERRPSSRSGSRGSPSSGTHDPRRAPAGTRPPSPWPAPRPRSARPRSAARAGRSCPG